MGHWMELRAEWADAEERKEANQSEHKNKRATADLSVAKMSRA